MGHQTENPTLGYAIFEPDRAEASAVIVINKSPTEDHFDPERVQIPIVTDRMVIIKNFGLPYAGPKNFPVAPGALRLKDRFNKRVDIWTFGGSASISATEDSFNLAFFSEAPTGLIEPHQKFDTLSRSQHISRLFIDFQALLAKIKPAWRFAELAYQNRLTSFGPTDLYGATLQEIVRHLDYIRGHGGQLDGNFLSYSNFISRELARLNQSEEQHILSDILSPDRY